MVGSTVCGELKSERLQLLKPGNGWLLFSECAGDEGQEQVRMNGWSSLGGTRRSLFHDYSSPLGLAFSYA